MTVFNNITKLREKLAGKKTYLTAIVFGILAGLRYYGVSVPEFVWPLLSAVGLGSMRAALNRIGGTT